jgi:hypothetical protein
VLPPNTNVEHKFSLCIHGTEKLRWVHGGKGQVAQCDRVRTTITCPDTGFSQPNKVPSNHCYHPIPRWKHKYSLFMLITEKLRLVHGGKGQVAWRACRKANYCFPQKFLHFPHFVCTKCIFFTLHSTAACHCLPNFVYPMHYSVMQYLIVESLFNILAIY